MLLKVATTLLRAEMYMDVGVPWIVDNTKTLSLRMQRHVANIGDVRSLVIHLASTTHAQLSPEEQLKAGITPGMVRLSIGLENADDIKTDLELGFTAAKK